MGNVIEVFENPTQIWGGYFRRKVYSRILLQLHAIIFAEYKPVPFYGSMGHANLTPFSIHVSFLFLNPFKLSEGLFNSITTLDQ